MEESFQQLLKHMRKLKANLPIIEMLYQSLCYVNFIKNLLILKHMSSDDKMIAITRDCYAIFKNQPLEKMEDPRCFKMPITIKDFYLVEVIYNRHYKKNCILRLLKLLIAAVRRVAIVHLRLFPNSRGCWGRNCHSRPFIEQSHQLPQKVLRHFRTVAK